MLNTFCAMLIVALLLVSPRKFVGIPQQASANASSEASKSEVACADSTKRGPDCAKQEFSKHGYPVMFPPDLTIVFGISSDPAKPSDLYLWADNQTDKAQRVYVCCTSTLLEHIDVYDSNGHRVLTKTEIDTLEGKAFTVVCSCSGWISVPPHTIRSVDSANISAGYSLSAGHYIITEKGTRPEGQVPTGQSAAKRQLAITIP